MKNDGNEFLGILCNLYLIALLGALTLYTGEGYWLLGDTKYVLFRNVSLICLGGWLVAGLPGRVRALAESLGQVRRGQSRAWSFSFLDWAVASYGASAVLSALCSAYGSLSWEGYDGWFMGAWSQVLFVGVYFFVSRQYDGAAWPLYLGEGAVALVTLLGLLHRLGVDPLGLHEGWNVADWEYGHMLSTLGNINWFCGFYSVALAFVAGHYLWEERKWLQPPLYGAAAGAFVLMGIQGSQGGLLILAVCMGMCLLAGYGNAVRLKKAFLLFTGFFLGMPLMEVLMNLQGEKAAVVRDGNIFDHMKWYHGIGGAAVCLLLFLAVRGRKGSARAEQDKRSKKIAGALVALGAAVFGVLFAVLVLGGVDDSFGSGRGLLWRIAWESFMEAGWKEKLLGVGPDCYGPAVFQRLAAGTDVWKGEHWDGALFTNAHCELLTQLCNVGILGTVCYVWVFLAGIWSFRKEARQAPGWRSVHGEWLGLAALAMYGAHSFVSFQQVLATPYLFLVLGLCENRKRRMRGLLGGQSH